MKSAKSIARRSRDWRWRYPGKEGKERIELLNLQWPDPRGAPSPRSCPICDANVSADHAIHHGGELYHPDCARQGGGASVNGPPPPTEVLPAQLTYLGTSDQSLRRISEGPT